MGLKRLISLGLLPILAGSTSSSASANRPFDLPNHSANNQLSRQRNVALKNNPVLALRGGSTKTPRSPEKYRMEQILLLQSRSERLREALTDRGVFQDYSTIDAPVVPQPVDWDCALSTEEKPKPCLYSFDAEPNTKVVAPAGTDQWISLESLVRLRRTDPSKVEPLWHNQYAIFDSWFKSGSTTTTKAASTSSKSKKQKAILQSTYSMYAHLPWQGHILALLLDFPLTLNMVVLATIGFALALTRPIWESMLTLLLTSQFMWKKWPSWARYVHVSFPFKLFMGQMAWKGLARAFSKVKGVVRDHLVEMESRIWEDCIPLTITEGKPPQLQDDESESEEVLLGDEDEGGDETEDESEEE